VRENYFQSETLLVGKGLPSGGPWTPASIAAQGASVLDEQVSLPVAVLSEAALRHNLAWMRRFTEAYGCQLAPHGKTTMSPALFQMQLDAGAWGITLATAPQTVAAYEHGVRRVLLANQLVGKGNFALIADLQARDADFWFACVVDSADNVAALGQYFQARGQQIKVLLEIGAVGGRTGIRDDVQARAVLDEIRRWPDAVALVGVEVYEGVAKDEAGVRAVLQRSLAQWQAIHAGGGFAQLPAILTGAGSAWFDVVAEEFSPLVGNADAQVVLRPGCYLTHDVGIYRQAARRIHASNPVAREMGSSLRPALRLWAYVQSLPESGKAIVALGKRDAAFDAGFPVPALHHRPGNAAPVDAPAHWQISAMMDQHAFLDVRDGDDLRVGDLLCFDISHPCLTFDKWRHLLVVDDAHRVIGAVSTQF
jgi:D-serine dehydratase